MIKILNGFEFQRNFDNTVYYSADSLATILGLQPHEVKEHYFYCVTDECFSEGEFHIEHIEKGEMDLLLPVFNTKALIDSLIREGFTIDVGASERLMESMLESQRIASECFEVKNGFLNYSDPIRKHELPFLKPIAESITKN